MKKDQKYYTGEEFKKVIGDYINLSVIRLGKKLRARAKARETLHIF